MMSRKPIHPVYCRCPQCDPRQPGRRGIDRSLHNAFVVCATLTAAFAILGLASLALGY